MRVAEQPALNCGHQTNSGGLGQFGLPLGQSKLLPLVGVSDRTEAKLSA